jgi:hypothetical protein
MVPTVFPDEQEHAGPNKDGSATTTTVSEAGRKRRMAEDRPETSRISRGISEKRRYARQGARRLFPQRSVLGSASHEGARHVGSPKQPAPPQSWQHNVPPPQRVRSPQRSPAERSTQRCPTTQPRTASKTSSGPQMQAIAVQSSPHGVPHTELQQVAAQVPPVRAQSMSGGSGSTSAHIGSATQPSSAS